MSIDANDSSSRPYSTPPDWGADPLGEFIEAARHNTILTFANMREQYNALAEIDRLYSQMIDNLTQSPEFVAGFFLCRTHSSFRGAVRLCLSGQVVESHMVLRGCIESALYGFYVAGDRDRQEIWLRRHDDDASMARVKGEFTIRRVMNHLQATDPKTQAIAQTLYDRTIDYGGHPNERAVTMQVRTERQGSRAEFTFEYLICGDLRHQVCLRSAAQVGICCLDIFYNIFRGRFRLLGINKRLDQIRQGF